MLSVVIWKGEKSPCTQVGKQHYHYTIVCGYRVNKCMISSPGVKELQSHYLWFDAITSLIDSWDSLVIGRERVLTVFLTLAPNVTQHSAGCSAVSMYKLKECPSALSQTWEANLWLSLTNFVIKFTHTIFLANIKYDLILRHKYYFLYWSCTQAFNQITVTLVNGWSKRCGRKLILTCSSPEAVDHVRSSYISEQQLVLHFHGFIFSVVRPLPSNAFSVAVEKRRETCANFRLNNVRAFHWIPAAFHREVEPGRHDRWKPHLEWHMLQSTNRHWKHSYIKTVISCIVSVYVWV